MTQTSSLFCSWLSKDPWHTEYSIFFDWERKQLDDICSPMWEQWSNYIGLCLQVLVSHKTGLFRNLNGNRVGFRNIFQQNSQNRSNEHNKNIKEGRIERFSLKNVIIFVSIGQAWSVVRDIKDVLESNSMCW